MVQANVRRAAASLLSCSALFPGLVLLTSCAASPPSSGPGTSDEVRRLVAQGAHRNVRLLTREGHDIYELTWGKTAVEIVPGLGSNVIRMVQDIGGKKHDIVATPPTMKRFQENGGPFLYGIPVLFPFADRWKRETACEGKTILTPWMEKDGSGNPIHGLVAKSPWGIAGAGQDQAGAWIETRITIDKPEWNELFGGLAMSIRYTLSDAGLTIRATVRNVGANTRMLSYGFHPNFLLAGDGGKAAYVVEAGNQLALPVARGDLSVPTGVVKPAGPYLLDGKAVDPGAEFFWANYSGFPRDGRGNATALLRFPGHYQVRLQFNAGFQHLTVWVPCKSLCDQLAIKPMAALEPLSSSIFANVIQEKDYAHLVVLKPGEQATGTFTVAAEPIR